MRIVTKSALSACVLSVFLLCGALGAQVAPPASATPAAQAPASPAQPDRAAHADDNYVIGDDDLLGVSVWKEPDLSKEIPVRSDGKISLPLIGEVVAAGRTPVQLELDITSKLKNYITDPHVTVIVEKINSQKFNILGEVVRPGAYPLTNGETIVDAVAVAGGFRDFAKKKAIYVLRQSSGGEQSHLNFNYQDFVKGKGTSVNVVLKPGDTVVVP